MTATAVTSLSMDPPSLLVCINRATSLHAPLLAARRFCLKGEFPDDLKQRIVRYFPLKK